jgi:hypothetical protein
MKLTALPDGLAIARLAPDAEVPDWVPRRGFVSVTRTDEELSIVCDQASMPDIVNAKRGWRALKIIGPLDLSMMGVLASVAWPLAGAGIPIFSIATYDTDYIRVPEERIDDAAAALTRSGHEMV